MTGQPKHPEPVNLYEQVFESCLREHKIVFESVVQTQRVEAGAGSVKNFDFLLHPKSDAPVLVELKGRTFHGGSLAGLKGLDAWVTFEDVQALSYWLNVCRQAKPATQAAFVFVFRMEQVDIETDGQVLYEYGGERFLMLAVPLEDYRKAMKRRSPRWQTVTLSAQDFRRVARPFDCLTTDCIARPLAATKGEPRMDTNEHQC
jgi:hypothetical protein